MKTLRFIAASFVLFTATLMAQGRAHRETDVFEATVTRIEPWPPIKITCGVAIVYRLAEYRVETVHRGHLHPGDDIVVRHLACNGNELDDLNVGDHVMLFATKLSKPEKTTRWSGKFGKERTVECPDDKNKKCFEVPAIPGDEVTIRYDADRLAKQIYPTFPLAQ